MKLRSLTFVIITSEVAPSRERELKHMIRRNAVWIGSVAPSRERELKLGYDSSFVLFTYVAPSRERELKQENAGGAVISQRRSLTGA